MKELQRIESREVFATPNRIMYRWNLSTRVVTFYQHGAPLDEAKLGEVIINLINALNTAESQISSLFELICNQRRKLSASDLEDYLEDYPVEEDYESKYKLHDVKEAVLHAMMKNDEKAISSYINQVNILQSCSENQNEA